MVNTAIRPQDAKLGVEFFLPAQSFLDLTITVFLIGRMHRMMPSVIGAAEAVRRHTVELVHPLVPRQAIVHYIIIPDSHFTAGQGQRQAF